MDYESKNYCLRATAVLSTIFSKDNFFNNLFQRCPHEELVILEQES